MSAVVDFPPGLLAGDTDAAVDFLNHLFGERVRVLVTIDPHDGPTVRRDFRADEEAGMRAFIDRAQGRHNVYYHFNPAPPGASPPTKGEVPEGLCFHLDADLKDRPDLTDAELLGLIRAYEPPATAIVASGGGYQAVWRHDGPSEAARIEASNKAIERAITGKQALCWNVNRLLRLPGTINVLNAKKRAAGRVPTLAQLVEADWSRTLSYERDPLPGLPEDSGFRPESERRTVEDLPAKWRKLAKSGDASDYDGDRSALVFAFIMALLRRGWADGDILPFLTEERYEISAHCRAQRNPEATARRQIERARARVVEDWERTERGTISADSQRNVRRALREMGIGLRYDEFAMRVLADGRFFDDAVGNHLRFTINDRFDFRSGKEFFFDFCGELARENTFHPVKAYLDGLVWDGVKRLDDWLFTYGGAPKGDDDYDKYVRKVGRITLIAAVRRVRQPGCKFDQMLVLVNPTQGTDKSTALAVLAVRPDWFTDSLDLGAKDKVAIEQTQGKWIVELGEMRGRRRNDVDQIKGFISRQRDRARLAYGRMPTEAPRQCIFVSSTNDVKFLTDRTGNRRYWPIIDVKFNIPELTRDRDQLWAEAAAAERDGESIELPQEMWGVAETVQNQSLEEEPWVEVIADALGEFVGKIRATDIWKILDVDPKARTPGGDNRMGAAMRELGWERKQRRYGGDPEWSYIKGGSDRQIYATRDPETRRCWVYQDNVSRDVSDPAAVTQRVHERPVTEEGLLLLYSTDEGAEVPQF